MPTISQKYEIRRILNNLKCGKVHKGIERILLKSKLTLSDFCQNVEKVLDGVSVEKDVEYIQLENLFKDILRIDPDIPKGKKKTTKKCNKKNKMFPNEECNEENLQREANVDEEIIKMVKEPINYEKKETTSQIKATKDKMYITRNGKFRKKKVIAEKATNEINEKLEKATNETNEKVISKKKIDSRHETTNETNEKVISKKKIDSRHETIEKEIANKKIDTSNNKNNDKQVLTDSELMFQVSSEIPLKRKRLSNDNLFCSEFWKEPTLPILPNLKKNNYSKNYLNSLLEKFISNIVQCESTYPAEVIAFYHIMTTQYQSVMLY